MKANRRKLISMMITASLTAGCFSGCTSEHITAESREAGENRALAAQEMSDEISADEVSAAADAAASLIRTHGSEEGKEETVYVIADASGTPDKTIVSAWLKNPEESETIKDRSDLMDIQNVKGDEDWTADADGNLIWNANGSDIYYQGTSEKELPVSVHVDYELDGKTVTPKDLDGASGHLKITFTYTNHTASERVVNGKTVTLYQPFVMISGVILDNEKASGVEVTNGKIINSGEQTIIAGMALPGLRESLGLDELTDGNDEPVDINLPEEVTIEADVTDFSMLMTLTVADNNVLKDLDLEDVETFDDLKDAMDELTDGSVKLVDGTKELYDGTEELKDGTGELSDGVAELNDGAVKLDDGAKELKDGAVSLDDGAGSLKDGAAALNSGLGELKAQVADMPEGIQALKNGAGTIKATLKSEDASQPGIYEGAAAIEAGAGTIAGALRSNDTSHPGIYEGAQGIESGASAIASGAVSNDASKPGIYEAAQLVREGLGGVADAVGNSIQSAASGLGAAKEYNQSAKEALQGLIESGSLTEEQQGAVSAALAALGGSDAYIDGVLDGLGGVSVDLSAADQALGSIQSGAQNIAQGAGAIQAGAGQIAGVAGQLSDGAGQLSLAASSIKNGVDTMISGNNGSNLNTMIDGLSVLEAGGRTLVSGVDQLKDGSGSLAEGSASLKDGTGKLKDGAVTLKNGTGDLKDGTRELKDGTQELADGVQELVDGAKELMDGMAEFDEDGIQKLAKLFRNDAQDFLDRLRALQDYAEEYSSFSGSGEEMPSSVRFIIRTDSIGE